MSHEKQQHKSTEQVFYEQAPRSMLASKGICSAALVIWMTVLLALVGALLILRFIKPLATLNTQSESSVGNYSFHLPRFSSSKPAPVLYTAIIVDQDLNERLRSLEVPRLSEMVARIHADGIVLQGSVIDPIKVPFSATLLPKVSNNKIKIEVNDFSAGGVRVLPLAGPAFRQAIEKALEDSIQSKFYGTISKIDLKEGSLVAHLAPPTK